HRCSRSRFWSHAAQIQCGEESYLITGHWRPQGQTVLPTILAGLISIRAFPVLLYFGPNARCVESSPLLTPSRLGAFPGTRRNQGITQHCAETLSGCGPIAPLRPMLGSVDDKHRAG